MSDTKYTRQEFLDGKVVLYGGDNRDVLRDLPDNSIDSIVTDPPYALVSIVKRFGSPNAAPAKGNDAYMRASAGFMGKQWDTGECAMDPAFWSEVLRVLKPGAHLAAFGASRGYHRMACAIEDAGFEIRDSIINVIDPESPVINFMQSLNDEQLGAFLRCLDDAEFGGTLAWMYGVGFPKSQNVAKFIDKELGAEGSLGGPRSAAHSAMLEFGVARRGEKHEGWDRPWMDNPKAIAAAQSTYIPSSPEAQRLDGFGTALKPAFEPIVLARKPLSESTVAANVLRWGTGALNIGATRIGTEVRHNAPAGNANNPDTATGPAQKGGFGMRADTDGTVATGRWPANVVHDGSDEVVGMFPMTKNGVAVNSKRKSEIIQNEVYGKGWKHSGNDEGYGVAGASESAARFFYSAKASKRDRDEGLDGLLPAVAGVGAMRDGGRESQPRKNTHPTVKPTALMQWLCRLITPPGGTVLDPFMGSGSTGKAAVWEGFKFVGCEREEEYIKIAEARIAYAVNNVPHVAAAVAAQQPANDNQPRDLFSGLAA